MISRRTVLALVPAAGLLRAETESGFTTLFDGKSLNGWTVADGPDSAFYVDDASIVVHSGSNYPTWLRSAKQYENFDFRGEFYLKGWMDSAIYLHAPEHGRAPETGLAIKLFHEAEAKPTPYSCGSIFPLIAPQQVKVNNKGQWNTFRVFFEWPRLQVWINDAPVQDVNVESVPELRYRLRKGYVGFQSLSYPIRFRNLRIQELPEREIWQSLYEKPSDIDGWVVSDGKPVIQPIGGILRLEGLGHIATKQKYKDFAFQTYIRTSKWHNGGVIFRSTGGGTHATKHYEIQLHNVEGAHFPTGSLYHYKRALYPRITDEQWWLYQMTVTGRQLVVRINGENVLEYDQLENVDEGYIELQAHASGTWAEFKQCKVKKV